MAEARPQRVKRRPSALQAYDSSPLSDADSAYDPDPSPSQTAPAPPPPPPPAKRAPRKSTGKGKAASGSPEPGPATPAPPRRTSTRRQTAGLAGPAASLEPTPVAAKPTPKPRAPPKKRKIAKVWSESEDENEVAPMVAAGTAELAALPQALPVLPTTPASAADAGAAAPPALVAPVLDEAVPTPYHPLSPPRPADQPVDPPAAGESTGLTMPTKATPQAASTIETAGRPVEARSPDLQTVPAIPPSTDLASSSSALPTTASAASPPAIPTGSTLTPIASQPISATAATPAETPTGVSPLFSEANLIPPTEQPAPEVAALASPATDLRPPSLATNEASAAATPVPPFITSPKLLPPFLGASTPAAPSPKPAESAPTPPVPAPAAPLAAAPVSAQKDEPKVKSRARTAAAVAAAGGGSFGSTPVRKKPKFSSSAAAAAGGGEEEADATPAGQGSMIASAPATSGGVTPSASTAKTGDSGLAAKGGALSRIPSMKKVAGAEQFKAQQTAGTPKAGFNIMQFKQKKEGPIAPKATATTKRPTETKVAKEFSPLMTHEQRRQEFLKRRGTERAERTAAEKDSLDLLEQIKGMQEFEAAYRVQVRQLIESEKPRVKDDIRLMLPRLSTFGSVFSLFPRKE